MLKMGSANLEASVIKHLSDKQAEIDQLPTYSEQVAKGKALWDSKSKANFRKIRAKLDILCVGKRRCNYCEDSVADEIEHIKPKALYPSLVFVWENYLYACGNCNGPKSDLFAVFSGEEVVEISRKRKDPVVPPLIGDNVFINPRIEDPMDFLALDLNTMAFIPKPRISSKDKARALYTRNVLRLNSRDFLVATRKEAFNTYFDSLQVYALKKNNGASTDRLLKRQKEIESRQHPTVWAEMKRQRNRHPELAALFESAPELL